MDSVHDMGGMDGFGKVVVEENEPPFHAKWEGRVLAMQRAMGYAGAWHIDGVTGPDEYSAVADDNVFTNPMAPHNLRAAVRACENGDLEE